MSEAKALIDGAAAERAKLREAWNDGDLSDEELEAKTDDLNDRIADAKLEIREAERRGYRLVQRVRLLRRSDASDTLTKSASPG